MTAVNTSNYVEKRLHIAIGIGAACRRDQPPGDQERADIHRKAGDAMQDGERHRQRPAVGLQVRR